MERICQGCGKPFSTIPSRIANGRGKYCSRDCANRYFRHHPIEKRFWPKVQKSVDCWEWIGAIDKAGYGRFSIPHNISGFAHRISWELHFGPIPEGLFVCHHCDNPRCVNPAHLFLGTNADNMRDAAVKGRMPLPAIPIYLQPNWKPARGEEAAKAKLTNAQVLAIREAYANGKVTQTKLGAEYGVSQSAIYLIVHRKNWTHI